MRHRLLGGEAGKLFAGLDQERQRGGTTKTEPHAVARRRAVDSKGIAGRELDSHGKRRRDEFDGTPVLRQGHPGEWRSRSALQLESFEGGKDGGAAQFEL